MNNVINKEEIMAKVSAKYGQIFTPSILEGIVDEVINTIHIDASEFYMYKAMHDGVIALVESLYPGNNVVQDNIDNFKMFDETNTAQPQAPIAQAYPYPMDVVSYITNDSVKSFKEQIFRAFLAEVNKERTITGDHLRSSCLYRTCYLRYKGIKYLEANQDSRYNTNESDMVAAFFLEYIFYGKDAYHEEGSNTPNKTKTPFLSPDNQQIDSLMKETRYRQLLAGKMHMLVPGLFIKYPGYKLTEEDCKNITQCVINRLTYKKDGN